ncbi:MAG: carboxypeptidase regulatory-like domain-containing protein [Spirochaetes bacterium]|nr:carboxypeptidase regulatory-like domain-containing protein [Spirochaetota bacterium]
MKRLKLLFVSCLLFIGSIFIDSAFSDGVVNEDGNTVYTDNLPKLEKSYIEGTITDYSTRKPVKGATVEFKNASRGVGYYKTETDRNGYYKINDFIAYIKYDIEITAPGYVSYTETASLSRVKNDIRLKPESIITGTIKDSSGKPLSDVEIKVNRDYYYNSSTFNPRFVKSDNNGNYKIDKLVSGHYMVTFSKSGYIAESASLNNIKEGESFNLAMVMYKPAVISGKINIKDINSPAVNINVTASGRYNYSNESFQDGSFQLEDIKPGTYTLILSHQGFNKIEKTNITVTEGKNVSGLNFDIEAKSPEIRVYSYRYTFTPGNEIEFNLRSLRLDTVHVKIYQVPASILIGGARDPESLNPGASGLKTVTEWDESVKNFDPYEWMYYTVKVNKPLPAGGYCIEVKGSGNTSARQFFTVTNVGVVLKRSPESVTAYVTDLVLNKPLKNISVIFYNEKLKDRDDNNNEYDYDGARELFLLENLPVTVLAKGKTDENGIYTGKLSSQKEMYMLAVSDEGSYSICASGSSNYYASEKDKLYIYTDRPVYRAGDKLFFKIIAKTLDGKFKPIKNKTLYYSIQTYSSDGKLAEGRLNLDEWGTANGSVQIPQNFSLGYFTIKAGFSEDNLYGSGSFYVEQYRKPEFKIDIIPSKDFFINGDMAEFKVEAKYFFGAPLNGALVKYTIFEKKIEDMDNSYDETYNRSSSYSRIKLEGEKYADAGGAALIKVASGNYPYDREITLEASVTDKSNITITTSKTVRVGRGEYFIKLNPEENYFDAKGDKNIKVFTATHAGKPVSASLEIKLFKYIWKPVQRVYVQDSRPFFSKKITTDKDGNGVISLPRDFNGYGEYNLVAQGVDSRNNNITGSKVIWIYSDYGGSEDAKYRELEVTLNKTSLEKSGKITCLVKSKFTDSYVMLSLEGRDVYQTKVIKMDKHAVSVTFDIDTKLAPNLFINGVMQRGRALYTTRSEVTIPVEDVKLDIALKPDKAKYLPGDKANIGITVVDSAGKPVSADLSLSAVDESIYYIRYDATPEISGFFYSKISNWVITTYSYPITLLAGSGKDGEVKVRENFKDTAFWTANIKTDQDGKAAISFTLPDNLTTWRLTARGHDLKGRMGEVREKFLSTMDLIARIGKPRFFVEGDKIGIIGIVNNNTDSGMSEITTEMKIDGKVVKADKDFKMSLPEFGSASKSYTFTVPEDKSAVALEFKSTSGNKGDAVKHTIPVEKRGLSYVISGAGDMQNNREIVLKPVKGSDDFEFVPEEIILYVNPSPVMQMIKAVEYLSRYPYGCVEQTINKIIPILAMQNLLSSGNYSQVIPDELKKNLNTMIPEGISRLEKAQNYDGTWGWWEGDRGNVYTTGFAIFSLFKAKGFGYKVSDSVLNNGQTALNRIFESPSKMSSNELAYLTYINSLYKKFNYTVFKRVANSKDLGPYQAANLIKAVNNIKGKGVLQRDVEAEVNDALKLLNKKIQETSQRDSYGIYWSAAQGQSWDWPGSNTEITAHVLSALVSSGDKSSLVSQAVASISKRFKDGYWGSTKESGTVILALCDYLTANSMSYKESGEVEFSLNGERLEKISYNVNSAPGSLKKEIKLDKNKKSDSYKLTATGTDSSHTTYSAALRGILYFKPKGVFSLFKSEKSGIEALSNGVTARREISYLNRVKDMKMQEYLVPQNIDDKSKINVGDELLVRIKFKAVDKFGYMILQDFLPAGFEVVKESAYNEYQSYSHIERRDNRMVFFFTNIEKNREYEVAYIMRAELPGSFMMRPSRIECMYEESIQGWSLPAALDVQDEKQK